jgi:NAD-dependent deacetylase
MQLVSSSNRLAERGVRGESALVGGIFPVRRVPSWLGRYQEPPSEASSNTLHTLTPVLDLIHGLALHNVSLGYRTVGNLTECDAASASASTLVQGTQGSSFEDVGASGLAELQWVVLHHNTVVRASLEGLRGDRLRCAQAFAALLAKCMESPPPVKDLDRSAEAIAAYSAAVCLRYLMEEEHACNKGATLENVLQVLSTIPLTRESTTLHMHAAAASGLKGLDVLSYAAHEGVGDLFQYAVDTLQTSLGVLRPPHCIDIPGIPGPLCVDRLDTDPLLLQRMQTGYQLWKHARKPLENSSGKHQVKSKDTFANNMSAVPLFKNVIMLRRSGEDNKRPELTVTPVGPVTCVSHPSVNTPTPTTRRSASTPTMVEKCADILQASKRVVVLSGAGLSKASGLVTRKELWQDYSRDSAVSVWRFQENPTVLWGVIKEFLGAPSTRSTGRWHFPNAAHTAINSMHTRFGNVAGILTQNVDELHQHAVLSADFDASGGVITDPASHLRSITRERMPFPIVELHGSLFRTMCHTCGAPNTASCHEIISDSHPNLQCAHCLTHSIRPDVVLFGEAVHRHHMQAAWDMAAAADCMLVVGCAMDVAPAVDLPRVAKQGGAVIIEINPTPSQLTHTLGTRFLAGAAEVVLPQLHACWDSQIQ